MKKNGWILVVIVVIIYAVIVNLREVNSKAAKNETSTISKEENTNDKIVTKTEDEYEPLNVDEKVYSIFSISDEILKVQYHGDDNLVVITRNATNGGDEYKYIISDKNENIITLTDGKGTYILKIYEADDNSKVLYNDTQKAQVINNSNEKYTISNYKVNYEHCKDFIDTEFAEYNTVDEIFNYFTTFNYNYSLFSKIQNKEINRYNVDVEQVIKNKSGICIDLATSMTAVLREKGYTARVCYGYKQEIDEYHSWVEVLVDDKWITYDPTFAKTSVDGKQDGYIAKEYH